MKRPADRTDIALLTLSLIGWVLILVEIVK